MAAFEGSDLELQIVEKEGENGETLAFLQLTNGAAQPLDRHWRLYFSLGLTPKKSETRVRQVLIDGRYGYLEPGKDWQPLQPGSSVRLSVENWLFNGMPLRARQGFHITTWQEGSNVEALDIPQVLEPALLPLDSLQNTWIPDQSPSCDTSAQTPEITWQKNLRGQTSEASNTVVPSLRSLQHRGDTFTLPGLTFDNEELIKVLPHIQCEDGLPVHAEIDASLEAETYSIDITDEQVSISAGSQKGLFYSAHSLRQLVQEEHGDLFLTACQIRDSPDFEHRGVFLDIARHYQPASEIRKVIQAMAAYKMNRLQLGISNDEGWRLEIPGIPELTDVGARRGFQANDEAGRPRGLYPAWGDGPEENHQFLSRGEFIGLLKFAHAHHVEIIPEFNLPAHANALIRSMAATGRYSIVDPDDESTHRSAQGYANNVVNVCMTDTYNLARKILQEISFCYQDAGAPFSRIHLGGDEVPRGAWLHSPACRKSDIWDPAWNAENEDDATVINQALLAYYAEQIRDIIEEISPNTITAFWHEMSPYIAAGSRSYITGWTTETGDRNLIDDVIGHGQNLVIANASFLYLDMPYGLHSEEPGLPWAAYIDEELIYDFDPLKCWQIPQQNVDQVKGLQAQLWGETVFTPALMGYYLFPRLLAVAERCWQAKPNPENWPLFAQALGQRELAYLESLNVDYRLPPPGASMVDNTLHANVAFPGLPICYTSDRQDPTIASTRYLGPITVDNMQEIRFATFSTSGKIASRVITIKTVSD